MLEFEAHGKQLSQNYQQPIAFSKLRINGGIRSKQL